MLFQAYQLTGLYNNNRVAGVVHKNSFALKKLFSAVFFTALFVLTYGQDVAEINRQQPFKINGNIGASANYYASNAEMASRPPWAWNLYGNFSARVYGIHLPFSFVVNQYGNSMTQPFSQFGISPEYKWAKLHLGVRYIQMSPLVFDGQSFRGVGLELKPKLFRFAGFYGKLNRKVNEDTTSGKFALPQFSRIGYGVKVGVGSEKHFIDLVYFHAKDDSTSAKILSGKELQSQENAVHWNFF